MTPEMINTVAAVALILLFLLVLYGHGKNRLLNVQKKKLDLDIQNILLAIEDSLLFIENDKVVKMNRLARELFGDLENKDYRQIFYKPDPSNGLLFGTPYQCQCVGKNEYLFPAELHAIKHENSPRWMLKISDRTFTNAPIEKTEPTLQDGETPPSFMNNKMSCSIIIVDDDESVLDTYREMIAFEGWRVQAFLTGAEALKEIKAQTNSIELLITDYKLREMTGMQLINQSRELIPELKSIIISGFSLSESQRGDVTFIQKPCPRELLINTIREQFKDGKSHFSKAL